MPLWCINFALHIPQYTTHLLFPPICRISCVDLYHLMKLKVSTSASHQYAVSCCILSAAYLTLKTPSADDGCLWAASKTTAAFAHLKPLPSRVPDDDGEDDINQTALEGCVHVPVPVGSLMSGELVWFLSIYLTNASSAQVHTVRSLYTISTPPVQLFPRGEFLYNLSPSPISRAPLLYRAAIAHPSTCCMAWRQCLGWGWVYF